MSIVFGTQALIQREVQFPNLGLAIIDEQHRFGVFDRARLKDLGPEADMLLMTATPIPRSLAMVMFSNLSISSLEEMPSGRAAISTRVLELDRLAEVHDLVRGEVKAGHRAYYVLPKIETDEEGALSVTGFADKLCVELGSAIRIGTIHGRLRPAEKERVMREFRDGELDVLVATTVIEVGIDVAEATVMIVMAAERYGLAQLHQLRGRVGRGTDASHCVLVISTDAESSSRRRAEVLARSARGADIAKADLDMRGPGDLFGARQTGPLPLRFMEFLPDFSAVERCRNWAEQWIKRDPALRTPESDGARQAVRQMLEFGFSLADVG
jgi:ATP-dependent DNA helicase RecG